MNVLCKWSKNKFNKGRAKEGSSTEPCPVYERIKLPVWSISPAWGGRWSIAELSLRYYIGDNYSYTPWEGSWSKVSYLRNNALAERDLTMRRMWLEQKKNTPRKLGRNKAFVKKGSSGDTEQKKENVKLNVKLYIDHKLQTCCRFILVHIYMY